jgi:hypothetical protein
VIRALIRIAFVVLVANAAWHLFGAYSVHYKFRDSVEEASLFGGLLSEAQLQQKVIDIATQFDVPVSADSFTVRRDGKHTLIDGSYKRPIELVPAFVYPWPFTWHVDTLSVLGGAVEAPVIPR